MTKVYSIILLAICCIGISGCAISMPGRQDLESKSVKLKLVQGGKYKEVALCIAKASENEPLKLRDLPLPSNLYRPDEKHQKVEIGNMGFAGQSYSWLATVHQVRKNTVQIDIIGRTNIWPSLSRDYVTKKIKKFAEGCKGSL